MPILEVPVEDTDLEPIFEETRPGYVVRLQSGPERMKGYLDITARQAGVSPPVEEVIELLRSSGLRFHPHLREQLTKALADGLPVCGLLAAEGTPPRQGAPGRLDWQVNLEAGKKREVKIVEGRADYHQVQQIVQVKEGEALLQVVPPEVGVSGEDIGGAEVPGIVGEPAAIEFGENVRFDAATATVFALVTGAVAFERDTVDVVPIFTVEGDVSLATGNISFDGAVVVTGDVQDDFQVEGKKGITVYGSVHAAQLETDGDILILQGVAGRGRGTLTAGGKVQVKYLNAAAVNCQGDLLVDSQVFNCQVRTAGFLKVRGNIVGGEIEAVLGVEARQIGSPMSVPTSISVGVDLQAAQKKAQLQARLATIEKDMARIYLAAKPHIDDPATIQALHERRRPAVQQLVDAYEKQRKLKQLLEKQLAEQEKKDTAEEEPTVKVWKTLFGKVTIVVGTCSQAFPVDVPGPVTITADPDTGHLRCR